MQNPPPVQTGKSGTGLDENIASLLAYAFGWLSGLILFLMEKDNRRVRFHAMQSILLNVVVIVVAIVFWIVISILVSVLLWLVFLAAIVAIWISCMVRAYQGKTFKLPFIGDMADKIVNK